MDRQQIKASLLESLPPGELEQVPEPDLAEPPYNSVDAHGQTCPHCGCSDCAPKAASSMFCCICPKCGCEWTPVRESKAKIITNLVLEARRSLIKRKLNDMRRNEVA